MKMTGLVRAIVVGLALASYSGLASAAEVVGVDANGTTKTVNQKVTAENSTGDSIGLLARNGGTITMNIDAGGEIISAKSTGTGDNKGDVVGIRVRGAEGQKNTITVTASAGGSISANSSEEDAFGIYVDNPGAECKVTGINALTVTGNTYAAGICNYEGSTITVNGANLVINVSSTKGRQYGIYSLGANVATVVTGLSALTVEGFYYAEGISSCDGSSTTVTANNAAVSVTATGQDPDAGVTGIYAWEKGSKTTVSGITNLTAQSLCDATGIAAIDSGVTEVTMNGTLQAKATEAGSVATGIFAGNGLTAEETDTNTSITTVTGVTDITVVSDSMSYGIVADAGGTANITMNGSLTVTGTGTEGSADAICADDTGSSITITGLTDLTVQGQVSAAGIGALDGAEVTAIVNGTLNVTALNGFVGGIYAQAVGAITTVTGLTSINVRGGTTASGIQSSDTATTLVKLSGNMYVVSNEAARAIVVGGYMAENKYLPDDPSTTTVIGVGASPSLISAAGGTFSALLYLDNGGTINTENLIGSEGLGVDTAFAIAAAEEGGTVNLAKTTLYGNIGYDATNSVAGTENVLNVNVDGTSVLYGATSITNNNADKNAVINIDNAGLWLVTNDSEVNTLTNNGVVGLLTAVDGFTNLQAATLAGNGRYVVNTDLENNTGDTITVGTSDNATVNITVGDDPSFVHVAEGNLAEGTHTLLTLDSGTLNVKVSPIDIGAYRITPTLVDNGHNGWDITGFKVGASEYTMTAADARAALDSLWHENTNNLSKRLGDLRLGQTDDDGIWARFQRSNSKLKGSREAKINANLFQVGYDKQFQRKDGKTYVGIAVDHSDGTSSFKRGGGDVKSTNVALYTTWLGNTGHYYDIILKQGHYSNDYRVTSITGMSTDKGDYGMNATSLSGEYGYRKQLKRGAYVEPQAEVIYGHLGGQDYTTSMGQVHVDGYNHFITRLGIAVGRQTQRGNYSARASYYHDFTGRGGISFNDYSYERDAVKNWAELTLGGDIKLGKKWHAYGEVSKYFGDVKNSLNYDIGVRCSF